MKFKPILKLTRKKIILFTFLILLTILGFNFLTPKKVASLQLAQVKRESIQSVVSASGSLTGKNTANLKFKSSGRLTYINIKVGDKVSQWSVIAGLDTQQMAIELQQAQNTLRDKQAIVDKIHDEVKNHNEDETFTQRQTRTTAEVAADNAFDSVKAAQRAFQDAVILTPINGIVTQAIQVSGQTVSSADLIAQIVDTSEIYFDADIDEADISKIAAGQVAEVTLDAYANQVFNGSVDQILPQTKTTSQGATVVSVRIKLDSPDLTFVNGLSGQTSIITHSAAGALTIPQEALREDNSVVLSENGRLIPKKVEPGLQSDTQVEIKNGLAEGEKVVLNPSSFTAGFNQNRGLRMVFPFFGGGRR